MFQPRGIDITARPMVTRGYGMSKIFALAVLLGCSIHAQQAAPSELRFQVASIRPANEEGDCYARDPGRFTCRTTVNKMISLAFDLRSYQTPFSFASLHAGQVYVVDAIIPADVAKKYGTARSEHAKDVKAMFRNLLIERFKLAYHYERKPLEGYRLTVAPGGFKPKFSPPPPPIGAPKDYVRPPGVAERGGFRGESWLDSVQAPMSAFVAQLSLIAFYGIPLTDDTALPGIYSFTLHYESEYARVHDPESSRGLPDIFEALSQQGLKLTPKKVIGDFFVIDHVERRATEN
jgi:uncharacterized protein (TIGR03435 family)